MEAGKTLSWTVGPRVTGGEEGAGPRAVSPERRRRGQRQCLSPAPSCSRSWQEAQAQSWPHRLIRDRETASWALLWVGGAWESQIAGPSWPCGACPGCVWRLARHGKAVSSLSIWVEMEGISRNASPIIQPWASSRARGNQVCLRQSFRRLLAHPPATAMN